MMERRVTFRVAFGLTRPGRPTAQVFSPWENWAIYFVHEKRTGRTHREIIDSLSQSARSRVPEARVIRRTAERLRLTKWGDGDLADAANHARVALGI